MREGREGMPRVQETKGELGTKRVGSQKSGVAHGARGASGLEAQPGVEVCQVPVVLRAWWLASALMCQ